MGVDWTKPIQTRDGRKARFMGDIKNDKSPKCVAVHDINGVEFVRPFAVSGFFWPNERVDADDIVNAPVTVEIGEKWISVYERADGTRYTGGSHDSLAMALSAQTYGGSRHLGPAKLPTTLTVEPA